jgi:serine/threonine protein phosphatase PrpC
MDIYNPQTKPVDPSDTRLIIMDGHGSHATNEFMAFCFLNNIYCCYFPAHCSHGMQPLNNGPFNAVKAVYRKELKKFNFNNDARPIDKINFIKAYNTARTAGLTAKNVQSASEPL